MKKIKEAHIFVCTYQIFLLLMVTIFCAIFTIPVYAQSYKEVTMSVGETQTFYLPSSVTSKDLKSVTFYSNGINYVQVTSYTNCSVTVKAIKTFSLPIIVRCDYRYFVRSGSYTYETSGAYDYRITVVGSGGESRVEPTSIKFSSTVKAIDVGESVQLTPTVLPANAEYTLTWSISDKYVATISQDGLLTGKSAGAADLKVKADNGVYAMLRVVVSEPKPTSVSISPSSVTLTEGGSRYLTVTVYPSTASQSVSWSSSNSSLVSVSSSGKITAIKAGTATITATTSNGKTGTCAVTCEEAIQSIVLSDKDGVSELPAKANVKYERMLYNGWNSMCLPFLLKREQLDVDGVKLVVVKDVETIGREKYVSLESVENVKPGEPCLVYTPVDYKLSLDLKEVQLVDTPSGSSILKGSFDDVEIGDGCYKLSSDGNSFSLTKSDKAVSKPFRAYINLGNDDRNSTRAASLILNNGIIYF
ncbi:MAG: Ig-like domain-containing protein [Prevotella sp.]|nr:Ig-like domain-containing protein [Prevotella sp.]